MAKLIPVVPDVNAFSQRVSLDDEYFVLSLRWNDRAARWYMDIADDLGAPIAAGLAVIVDLPMTAHLVAYDRMPLGIFVAVDGTGMGVDPGFAELGERVKLVYLEAADLV